MEFTFFDDPHATGQERRVGFEPETVDEVAGLNYLVREVANAVSPESDQIVAAVCGYITFETRDDKQRAMSLAFSRFNMLTQAIELVVDEIALSEAEKIARQFIAANSFKGHLEVPNHLPEDLG